MSQFRQLSDRFFASPQIELADIEAAKAAGIALIVNNRPDGEDPSAPQSAEVGAAAEAAGIGYCVIPVSHAGFSMAQIDAMGEALSSTEGRVLGYCRSGTRSTLLWAMARAKAGESPDAVAAAAQAAGYSVDPVRPTLDMLAGTASE